MLKRSTSVSKVCVRYDFCSEKKYKATPDVLVEKIELTLYIIKQEDKISQQEKRIQDLENT